MLEVAVVVQITLVVTLEMLEVLVVAVLVLLLQHKQ